jgi:hypothetical protein
MRRDSDPSMAGSFSPGRGAAGAALVLAAIAAMALFGCQQFFTTSLASSLARSSLSIPSNLSTSQAADLAAQAKDNQDTKLAGALVTSLVTEIGAMPASSDKTQLQTSAATAAIVASGTSSALTGIIGDYSSGSTPSSQTLIDLVKTVQAGATGSVPTALLYLDPGSAGGMSSADIAASGLGPTDLAIAAVVVASSALPANTDPTTMTPAQVATFQATPEAQASIRIINEASTMVQPNTPSADLLNSILKQFSLPPS